ncbi:unnamed protein product, partial [Prorocentrum cordatum]
MLMMTMTTSDGACKLEFGRKAAAMSGGCKDHGAATASAPLSQYLHLRETADRIQAQCFPEAERGARGRHDQCICGQARSPPRASHCEHAGPRALARAAAGNEGDDGDADGDGAGD